MTIEEKAAISHEGQVKVEMRAKILKAYSDESYPIDSVGFDDDLFSDDIVLEIAEDAEEIIVEQPVFLNEEESTETATFVFDNNEPIRTNLSYEVEEDKSENLITEPTAKNFSFHISNPLKQILGRIEKVDFRASANLSDGERLTEKDLMVLIADEIIKAANSLNLGLRLYQGTIYIFNGQYWQMLESEQVKTFLNQAMEKLEADSIKTRHFKFKDELYKQFIEELNQPFGNESENSILINFKNGTLEISKDRINFREFRREDFLTYQLSFEYDETAICPRWNSFLDEAIPELWKQQNLAEFFGYVFAPHLKLEKVLLLYGSGGNGKGVVFEVITEMIGEKNVSNISLESLGKEHYRAKLANTLLNYSSDISDHLKVAIFKQLASGEPLEARMLYGQPFTIKKYARLAFNLNKLPRDVEHTEAYFRRFLIIPFENKVAEEKQNPNLHNELIESELPGIFNWVMQGLQRIIKQNKFTPSEESKKILAKYRTTSDTVAMFLEEEGYKPSSKYIPFKRLYQEYRDYCRDNGNNALNTSNFKERLSSHKIEIKRQNIGQVAYLEKSDLD